MANPLPSCLAAALAFWVGGARPAQALNFNLIPDASTPQYVVDAFGTAGAAWSSVLGNDITVNLGIGYTAMGSFTLGETSYNYVQQPYAAVTAALRAGATSADDLSAYSHLQSGDNYSRLINRTTDNPNGAGSATTYLNSLSPVSMTSPNARALGFATAGSTDGSIRFNSGLPFDFNPADGITSGQYDFVGVAMHEIGHVLGFASIINQLEQQPGTAANLPATVLDLFRFSAASLQAGSGFIDTSSDTRPKYFSVDGGATAVAQFALGSTTGYQADHWKEFTFTGLMDPQTFSGSLRRIRPTDLRAFDVIGYQVVPEPSAGLILLGAGLVFWRFKAKL